MTENFRREIIFVTIPEAGSPKVAREAKPPHYPSNQREHWRPQRAIPGSRKAKATQRLIEGIARQDASVRDFMWKARYGV